MAEHIKVKVKSLSRVRLFATPWTAAYQAPPSMGFSRQEYWIGLPFPSPEDLPNPRIEPRSPAMQADALPSESGRAHIRSQSPPSKELRNCPKWMWMWTWGPLGNDQESGRAKTRLSPKSLKPYSGVPGSGEAASTPGHLHSQPSPATRPHLTDIPSACANPAPQPLHRRTHRRASRPPPLPPPPSTPRPARPAGPATPAERGCRGSPPPPRACVKGFRGAGAPPADQCGTVKAQGPIQTPGQKEFCEDPHSMTFLSAQDQVGAAE